MQSMYIPRAIEQSVLEASEAFPVVAVTGPRQVGKTTMLRRLSAAGRSYATLGDPEVRELAKRDPKLLLQRLGTPCFIDEIQHAPELLPAIKVHVDACGERGAYWLAGSQDFSRMKGLEESLAGRIGIFRMLGLSGSERAGIPTVPFAAERAGLQRRTAAPASDRDLIAAIWRGSLPELHANPELQPSALFASFVDAYIRHDVRSILDVKDETVFYRFLKAAAERIATPLVYEDMAGGVGVSAPTVKKWISLLCVSGIALLLHPYREPMLKGTAKAPVLYFFDTGLAAYLAQRPTPETLEAGAMSQQLFRNYVVAEICKSWMHSGEVPPVYCYRDRYGRKIDVLIHANGKMHPVAVHAGSSPGKDAVRDFKVLDKLSLCRRGQGGVVCLAQACAPLDDQDAIIPAWLI